MVRTTKSVMVGFAATLFYYAVPLIARTVYFIWQVAISMLDSHNHSEAVGHLELATGKYLTGAVPLVKHVVDSVYRNRRSNCRALASVLQVGVCGGYPSLVRL